MRTLIKNVVVIQKDRKFNGSVLINERIIENIFENDVCNINAAHIIDGKGYFLAPGMVDIHIHGSYGYDFINNPKETVDIVSRGLIKEGTTSFLASLTVLPQNETIKLLKAYKDLDEKQAGANFLGVHLEGPYLSYEKRQLMDGRFLRNPSIKEFDEMLQAADGKLKYMTIAPELDGMDDFIKYANEKVILSIGHTMTDCNTALKAIKLGCKSFTHLYNAMGQHLHRQPMAVTAALTDNTAYSELIVDGNHIHPDVVKATYRILGSNQIILITDSMLAKDMADGEYIFSNLACKKQGNRINVIETGIFAGSVITQLDAIKNMKEYCKCDEVELFKMASYNPCKLLGIKNKGSIEIGKDADLILLDVNLNLKATFVGGKQLY